MRWTLAYLAIGSLFFAWSLSLGRLPLAFEAGGFWWMLGGFNEAVRR